MLERMWSNRNSHSLLLGMQNSTATLEDSLAVSYKGSCHIKVMPPLCALCEQLTSNDWKIQGHKRPTPCLKSKGPPSPELPVGMAEDSVPNVSQFSSSLCPFPLPSFPYRCSSQKHFLKFSLCKSFSQILNPRRPNLRELVWKQIIRWYFGAGSPVVNENTVIGCRWNTDSSQQVYAMVKTFTVGEREGLHWWYNIRSLRNLVEEVIIRTLMALAESYLFYALA